MPWTTAAQRSWIWFGIASGATGCYSGSMSKIKRWKVSKNSNEPIKLWNEHWEKVHPLAAAVDTYLTPATDFLGVNPRPMLLSLSLNESGVEADNEDRDGRDMAMDLDERSRTCHSNVECKTHKRDARRRKKKKTFFN